MYTSFCPARIVRLRGSPPLSLSLSELLCKGANCTSLLHIYFTSSSFYSSSSFRDSLIPLLLLLPRGFVSLSSYLLYTLSLRSMAFQNTIAYRSADVCFSTRKMKLFQSCLQRDIVPVVQRFTTTRLLALQGCARGSLV